MGNPQEHRRHQAIARYLAGDPIETICRELHCAKSWLYKWKARYQADDPGWATRRSTQPRLRPTKPRSRWHSASSRCTGPWCTAANGGVPQPSSRISNSKDSSRFPRCVRSIVSCNGRQRRTSNVTRGLPLSMALWYSSRGHEVMARRPVDRASSVQSQPQEGSVMSTVKRGWVVRWGTRPVAKV